MATKREHKMARRAGQYRRLWREGKQRREEAERERARFSEGVKRSPRYGSGGMKAEATPGD
jgi:hypothetical protein